MSDTQMPIDISLQSVLVAYDFSDVSRKPLRHAVSIARHFGAKLYVAYVVSSIGYEIAGPESAQMALEGSFRDARRLEKELLDDGTLTGVDYQFLVRQGSVWNELKMLIEEKHVDAVVVGTHAREGIGRLALGSVAEQIFRQADCLVLTVGPRAHEDSLIDRKEGVVRPFLFATDFSPASLRALPSAASFAKHFGARLAVLNVLPAAPIPRNFHWSTTGDLPEMRSRAQSESEALFQELVLPFVPALTQVDFLVRFGIVPEQILQACHSMKADLVVLGLDVAKHAQTASHMPWGSAHRIVCGANCPVLTLKSEPALAPAP